MEFKSSLKKLLRHVMVISMFLVVFSAIGLISNIEYKVEAYIFWGILAFFYGLSLYPFDKVSYEEYHRYF